MEKGKCHEDGKNLSLPRKTRSFVLLVATTAVLIAMLACDSTPTTPKTTTSTTTSTPSTSTSTSTSTSISTTTTSIPACEKNRTGTLRVENKSTRNLDYNVIIDNINYGRLKVGERREFELLTGMHTLVFAWADHVGNACGGTASIYVCEMTWLYCDQ